MLEQEVAALIEKLGVKVIRGPYFNATLWGRSGKCVWAVKTVLTAAQLAKFGIDPTNKPDSQRTLRFTGDVQEGVVNNFRHISTSERKRVAPKRRVRAAS